MLKKFSHLGLAGIMSACEKAVEQTEQGVVLANGQPPLTELEAYYLKDLLGAHQRKVDHS
jgi:hypothetical protein